MFTPGQKVKTSIAPTGRAEVVKTFKNGKVRVAYWVEKLGGKVELWKENVRASDLEAL